MDGNGALQTQPITHIKNLTLRSTHAELDTEIRFCGLRMAVFIAETQHCAVEMSQVAFPVNKNVKFVKIATNYQRTHTI